MAGALAVVLVGCGGDGDGGSDSGGGSASSVAESREITGLRTFGELTQDHVAPPVSYAETPPVGGDHSPVVQTCGAYDQPVPSEQAVHSMEHGAVWITYRPDLPRAQVESLRRRARQSHVLVSPYPGLPAPVVASAWGLQVRLESADDPRLEQFVAQFRQGPQTPEPGASCRGVGKPVVGGS